MDESFILSGQLLVTAGPTRLPVPIMPYQYHDKPLVVYLDMSVDIYDEATRKNVDFLESIRNHSMIQGRRIHIVIQPISLTPQNTAVTLVNDSRTSDKSRINSFKDSEENDLLQSSLKQTIQDNAKLDGKHVALLLTKSYALRSDLAQINTTFENFVIEKMGNQTFIFVACFGCQINSNDFRGSVDRLRLFTDLKSFADVCNTVLSK